MNQEEDQVKDRAEVVCILDRSGSMASIIDDAIGGYNAFLADQKKIDKPADLMVVQFDDKYEVPFRGSLKDAPDMTRETYVPRGSTALLDAIGKTIIEIGVKLNAMEESQRPDRVIFVIITDGEENSSREFDHHKINEMITQQRDVYNWDFIFLAAGQDAIASAAKMGIHGRHAINYMATPKSAQGAYNMMNRVVGASRSSSSAREGRAKMDSMLNSDIDESGKVVKRN